MNAESPPPLQALLQMICSRYERLCAPATYADFQAHVTPMAAAVLNGAPGDARMDSSASLLGQLTLHVPSFYSVHVAPGLAQEITKKKAKRIKELMEPLERALLHCMTARFPMLAPVIGAPDHALVHIKAHDSILQKHADADTTTREGRAYGGWRRHQNHRSLLTQTPNLLGSLVADPGWMSKNRAAEEVGAYLCKQGRDKHFSVSRSPTTWKETVLKYMRKNPEAKAAFERHRRKP